MNAYKMYIILYVILVIADIQCNDTNMGYILNSVDYVHFAESLRIPLEVS